MKIKRVLRDLLVLVAFCGSFLLFIYLVGGLDGNGDDDSVDFSQNRVVADTAVEKKDWETALANLKAIIDRDPYDGRAQFEYARIYYRLRGVALVKLSEFAISEVRNREYRAVEEELKINSQRATEELLKAKDHARYRGRALLWLAVIACDDGDFEAALKYLEEFVDAGNYTPDRLNRYRAFGTGGDAMTGPGQEIQPDTRLHALPKFWEIVRKENANRNGF